MRIFTINTANRPIGKIDNTIGRFYHVHLLPIISREETVHPHHDSQMHLAAFDAAGCSPTLRPTAHYFASSDSPDNSEVLYGRFAFKCTEMFTCVRLHECARTSHPGSRPTYDIELHERVGPSAKRFCH